MAKNLYEVFEEFKAAPTREDKIAVLRNNRTYALYNVLQLAFHPEVKFLVDKVPYYKPDDSPPGLGYSTIHHELDRIYLMLANHPRTPPSLTQERREQILVQMLEGMEAQEATIFMNMMLKDLKVPGLDSDIVQEAFPGIIS